MSQVGDLRPCPFCGGEANGEGHVRYSRPLDGTWWEDGSEITEAFYVNCTKCGINNGCTGLVGGYRTKAEAIARWNTRTPTDLERSLGEAAQAIINRMTSTYKARNGREVGI